MSIKVEHQLNNQETLKSLIKVRKQIVDKISQLCKRKHFLQAEPNHKTSQHQQEEPNGKPRKMVKAQQGKQSQLENTPKKEQRSLTHIPKQAESQAIKKLREQQLMRNKRLFGGLNLHLNKAKSKIQQQQNKRESTNKIYQKIQQKDKQANQQILKQQITKINIQLAQQEKLKEQNSRQILTIQNLILLNSYTKYANSIKPFTFTKTQPSISWKPSQQIMGAAKKLLGEREKENQEKTKKIIQSIEKYENKFDYSLYILQNESEYYANLLKNYYHETKPFYRTENQPHILWKPAQDPSNLSTLKEQSNAKIDEVMKSRQQICRSYYNEKIGQLKERRDKGHDGERSESASPQKQEQD